ncbi:major facilitator family transporter domain protein [Burkholderia pseudomallei MSHR840]|nr:major facilitator family transporter domain protein [Burkholderia pseudomallei MSHR840]
MTIKTLRQEPVLAGAASPADTPAFTSGTLAALVAFAAITPLLLLVAPAVAGQLGAQLGLSASQIGTYFFVELGAFSAATLPSYLWLGRIDARRIARARPPCSARAISRPPYGCRASRRYSRCARQRRSAAAR